MTEFFTHVFYAGWILSGIWEVFAMANPQSRIDSRKKKKELRGRIEKGEVEAKEGCGSAISALTVLLWMSLGLLTSFWALFLAYLALSLVMSSVKKYRAGTFVDAMLSAPFSFFVAINHFHLHYTQEQILSFIGL